MEQKRAIQNSVSSLDPIPLRPIQLTGSLLPCKRLRRGTFHSLTVEKYIQAASMELRSNTKMATIYTRAGTYRCKYDENLLKFDRLSTFPQTGDHNALYSL